MEENCKLKKYFNLSIKLAIALTYLHTNDCFHRDLKPANILIKETNNKINFYLCDFSESKIIQNEMKTNYETLK